MELSSRPRKKSQPFNLPKTAALKAKIESNAKESPLLCLPREVRNRIWKMAVGDRLLHLSEEALGDPTDENSSGKKTELIVFCCSASSSEEQFFERFQARASEINEYPHRTCIEHAALRRARRKAGGADFVEGCVESQEDTLAVPLLRVCRQVYVEANLILWSTNTFSFQRTEAFRRFLSERLTSQKASIRSLHLDFSWGHNAAVGRSYLDCGMPSAGSKTTIEALKGLRRLHVYLEDSFLPFILGDTREAAIKFWRELMRRVVDSESLTKYTLLPLEEVTIVLTDIKERDEFWPVTREGWRQKERSKFAEEVRQIILDPKGREKLEQESGDARKTRAIQTEKRRLRSEPCQQASTRAGCAAMKREEQTARVGATAFATITRARACGAEHVCLVCLNERRRGREEARACPAPGRCLGDQVSILCVNMVGGLFNPGQIQTWQLSVRSEEDLGSVAERCKMAVGLTAPIALNCKGKFLNLSSAVREAGLVSGDRVEFLALELA